MMPEDKENKARDTMLTLMGRVQALNEVSDLLMEIQEKRGEIPQLAEGADAEAYVRHCEALTMFAMNSLTEFSNRLKMLGDEAKETFDAFKFEHFPGRSFERH